MSSQSLKKIYETIDILSNIKYSNTDSSKILSITENISNNISDLSNELTDLSNLTYSDYLKDTKNTIEQNDYKKIYENIINEGKKEISKIDENKKNIEKKDENKKTMHDIIKKIQKYTLNNEKPIKIDLIINNIPTKGGYIKDIINNIKLKQDKNISYYKANKYIHSITKTNDSYDLILLFRKNINTYQGNNYNIYDYNDNYVSYKILYNNIKLILKIFNNKIDMENLIKKYHKDRQITKLVPSIYFYGDITINNSKYQYVITDPYNKFIPIKENDLTDISIIKKNIKKIINLVNLLDSLPSDNNKKYYIKNLKLDDIGFDDKNNIILLNYNIDSITNESPIYNKYIKKNHNNFDNINIYNIGIIILELFFNSIYISFDKYNDSNFSQFNNFFNKSEIKKSFDTFISKSKYIKQLLLLCYIHEDTYHRQIFIYNEKKILAYTYKQIKEKLEDILKSIHSTTTTKKSYYDKYLKYKNKYLTLKKS